jgi:acetyl esterase/lipase
MTIPAPDMSSATSRMTPTMARTFQRILTEDAHLPNQMHLPMAQARLHNAVASSRWRYKDDGSLNISFFSIPCPRHDMAAVRLTRKVGARKGTLLFIHGGGWVFGSLHSHLGTMARLAELTGLTVIGIDYGLAPEAPFPAGLNDSACAWAWLRAEQEALGLQGPWLVSGDSAGANIALALLLQLRDATQPSFDAALLFYGVYSDDHQSASHLRFGGGQFGLSTEKMAWYRQLYLDGQHDPRAPLVSPVYADLAGLPPIFMNAAGLDCLRDDSVLLAQRLAQIGAPHQFKMVEGVTHGFMQMSSEVHEALTAFQDAAAFVAALLPAR